MECFLRAPYTGNTLESSSLRGRMPGECDRSLVGHKCAIKSVVGSISAASAKRPFQKPSKILLIQSSLLWLADLRVVAIGGDCGLVGVPDPSSDRAPVATGRLLANLHPGTRFSSSKHCRMSSRMPCSSQDARASRSSQKIGPQNTSSSKALRRENDQKFKAGLGPATSQGWRMDCERRPETRAIRMVGSAWRTWLTTQAADELTDMASLQSSKRTWASSRQAPIFLLHDKVLKPGKGSTCFSSENQFQVKDVTITQQGVRQS